MGNRPLGMKIRRSCTPRVSRPPPNQTQSWRPCFPGPPRDRGWRRAHLLVPSPRGEMIGSSARAVARDHALPRFLSSRKCTRSWWIGGRPLFTARSGSSASSILATLDGRAATGYVDISPGGECGCSALVPAKRRRLEELSSSPVQSL